MRLHIRYSSVFAYDGLVRESHNELRVAPSATTRQQVIAFELRTVPASQVVSSVDYWGTQVHAFGIREPHVSMTVTAEALVETGGPPALPTQPVALSEARSARFLEDHHEFLQPTRHTTWAESVTDFVGAVDLGDEVVGAVNAIATAAHGTVVYEAGKTDIGTTAEQVASGGKGVCQDFAHLCVAACRSIGIPARYVSGYLFTASDATGEDSSEDIVEVQTHAWFEAAVPNQGWIALDPTNNQPVGPRHVKIGHGRDYDDVPPLRGVYRGDASPDVDAGVSIRRFTAQEDPTTASHDQ